MNVWGHQIIEWIYVPLDADGLFMHAHFTIVLTTMKFNTFFSNKLMNLLSLLLISNDPKGSSYAI